MTEYETKMLDAMERLLGALDSIDDTLGSMANDIEALSALFDAASCHVHSHSNPDAQAFRISDINA